MKFLLEFVTCCSSPRLHPDDEKSFVLPAPPAPSPASSHVAANNSHTSRTRRRTKRPKKKVSSQDWRPSLGAIAEDNTITGTTPPPTRGGRRSTSTTVSGRDVKRKSNGGGSGRCDGGVVPPSSSVKVRPRSHNDRHYRSPTIPTIIPPFSASPFMF
ncbi:hypothetical protein HN51_011434 [Arachis hypogaea]|uniref:Uncharacterized protein n=2 Tax=Arachis TaxID=3817 RepID=A0A445DZ46_ARAHY|nr:uncharacterized protein LOC110279092 [Arachis duranensis]XP_025670198.1 uncharacterized protein LOC112769970 [Arachis hypogaea]QHO56740.1 uncharacterized protein DS421_3g76290 [Arachis hypogaea]RYR68427.1 hypothetical protein Ahy_A03g014933 [Arachis hypogaea]